MRWCDSRFFVALKPCAVCKIRFQGCFCVNKCKKTKKYLVKSKKLTTFALAKSQGRLAIKMHP